MVEWQSEARAGTGAALRLPWRSVAVLALILILLGRVQPTPFDRARAYSGIARRPVLETLRVPLRSAGQLDGQFAQSSSLSGQSAPEGAECAAAAVAERGACRWNSA